MAKKVCTVCKKNKSLDDYYICAERYKAECKECTNKRNKKTKKDKKSRERRYGTPAYLEYQREYYRKNKERFAQARKEWTARNPDYFKNYEVRRREIYHQKKAEAAAIAAALNTEADIV